jgi:hypothetical protein
LLHIYPQYCRCCLRCCWDEKLWKEKEVARAWRSSTFWNNHNNTDTDSTPSHAPLIAIVGQCRKGDGIIRVQGFVVSVKNIKVGQNSKGHQRGCQICYSRTSTAATVRNANPKNNVATAFWWKVPEMFFLSISVYSINYDHLPLITDWKRNIPWAESASVYVTEDQTPIIVATVLSHTLDNNLLLEGKNCKRTPLSFLLSSNISNSKKKMVPRKPITIFTWKKARR